MVDSKRLRTRWLVVAMSVVCLLVTGSAASANPSGSGARHVIVRGPCSDESHWRLHLVQHRWFIGVGFQVRSGVPDEIWRVRIDHGRRTLFKDLSTTNADGILAVRRPILNTPGLDYVMARARNIETGELCVGRALI